MSDFCHTDNTRSIFIIIPRLFPQDVDQRHVVMKIDFYLDVCSTSSCLRRTTLSTTETAWTPRREGSSPHSLFTTTTRGRGVCWRLHATTRHVTAAASSPRVQVATASIDVFCWHIHDHRDCQQLTVFAAIFFFTPCPLQHCTSSHTMPICHYRYEVLECNALLNKWRWYRDSTTT